MAAALIALASSATAATVTITNLGNPGKYVATPDADPVWSAQLGGYDQRAVVDPGGFWTFCLETNEYFNSPGTYNVNFSTTNSTDGGAGPVPGQPDNISIGTAYLYELFVTGSLFTDTAPSKYTVAQGADVQRAIWILEEENKGSYASIVMSPYIQGLLTGQFTNNGIDYTSNYNGSTVGVMNLTAADGKHQDQLVYHGGPPVRAGTVPDGGASLILLGISLGGLGLARRFSRA